MPQHQAYGDHGYYWSYLKLQEEPNRNEFIDSLYPQASRAVDKRARRQFGRLDDPTRRRYKNHGGGRRKLFVDDISEDVGVVVEYRYAGGREWYTLDSISYELGPEGAPDGWLEPQPFTYIELYPANPQLAVWPDSRGFRDYPPEIRVTARWGWPEVPDTIKDVTTELVGMYTLQNPRYKIEVTGMGVPINLPRDVRVFVDRMLGDYRKVIF